MKKIFYAVLIFLFVFSTSMPAFAAIGPDDWLGNTSGNFNGTPDNWSGSSTNNPPVSGDSWVFDGAGLSGLTLNNNFTSYSVDGITFNSDAAAYIINGNSLTLTGAIANNSSNTETLGTGLAGTITNSGTGTGLTLINGSIASSVTAITEDSASSALTINSGLSVNSGGTVLTNSNPSGSSILTASDGVSGTGNLILNNDSAIADGITLSSVSVNNTGIIINSGTGSGSTLISGGVGSNVTGITENSPASALTISGGLLVNSSSTTLTNSNSSGSNLLTLSGGVGGTGNLVLDNNSSIAGGITLSGSTVDNTGTITNSGTGTGSTVISAEIGPDVTAVTQDSSTSSLVLSGANTSYTGNVTVSAGILNIQNAYALGSGAGSTSVASGATLQMQGGAVTPAEALTLNGTGVSSNGALESVSGNNTYGGLITLGSAAQINADAGSLVLSNTGTITGSGDDLTIGGAGNTTVDGIIGTGAGTLTKEGTGTLILTGANTYSGITTISGGTLQIGNAGTTGSLGTGAVTDNANLTFDLSNSPSSVSNVISGTGSVTQNGTGTMTLSGGNNYSGGTIVNAGTLTATGVSALGATTGTLSVNNTNTGAGDDVVLNLSTTAPTTTGSLSGSMATPSSGTNTATINNGGELFTVNQTANGTYAGVIAGTGGFTLGSLSTATLTLTGDNTYSGATTISDGILNIQNNGALSGSGTTVASGAALQIQNNITTSAEPLTLNGTGIANSGALENVSGNNTYAGLITLGSATQINSDTGSLTLSNTGTITGSGDDLTIDGVGNTTINSIIGTGAGTLTKDGTGTLTLTGANTYTGGTSLNNGILDFANGSLGSGTFEFTGNSTLQWATGNTQDISSSMKIDDGITATLDTQSNTVTLGSALQLGLSGTGGLIKIGTGTLILSGANTYSGGTTVDAGTLTATGVSGLGATTGTLSVNNTNTGAGNAVVLNLSTTAATTTGSLSGSMATPSSGTNTATINNGGELFTVNQTANGTYAGVIAGTGGFTLGNSSSDTLTLSGDNTYSGGTTISAGKMQVENASALGTGSVVNDATLVLGTTNLTLGSGSSYTQGTGSALYLTVDSASNFGKITFTSAVAAAVAAGSSVNVGVGGYILNNSTFDIINTEGAGVGADPATVTSTSSLVSFSSSIVGGNLVLTADNSGFASLGDNANSRAVGRALDSFTTTPTGDMATVLNELEVLSNGNDGKITSALNTMGPVIDGGVIQNSSAALDNLVTATLDRIQNNLDHVTSANPAGTGVSSGDESGMNGVWAKPYGSYLSQGTLQGIQGYDAWNAGTVVGIDRMITDDFTLGVSGGYAYGEVNSDVNNANTDINSAQGTIYAGYQDPNLNYFIDMAGTFAWNWYDGQRDIEVGNINRTADAGYDGQQYGTYVEGGYKLNPGGNWSITPLASLQWTHLAIDSYTETNAGALDLKVDSQSYDILESGLGASVSYPEEYTWGNFTPELHAKWLYDFIDDSMVVTSSFTGGGASFTSNGATPAKEGADVGGKLSLDFTNNLSLIAAVDTELKNGFFGVYGSGTVRYKF